MSYNKLDKEYISLETAKLAMQLEYNNPECRAYYHICDGYTKGHAFCHYNSYIMPSDDTSVQAPRQSVLQTWLREEFHTHVEVTTEFYRKGINHLVQVLIWDVGKEIFYHKSCTGKYGDNGEFKTYEEALEFGLQKALKSILEIKESVIGICMRKPGYYWVNLDGTWTVAMWHVLDFDDGR